MKVWCIGIVLFLLSFSLRIYHVDRFMEFLGDQGRTSIELYQWAQTGNVPLIGPTVLTGQHLGPIFYYLLAPSYHFTQYNPVGGAVFQAVVASVSVYFLFLLLFRIVKGIDVPFLLSAIIATSPVFIRQDRTIWEPYVVPFFVVVYLLCLHIVYHDRKYVCLPIAGVCVGVLVQLHYPNVLFIPASLVFLGILYRHRGTGIDRKTFFLRTFFSVCGFILPLIPFLWFEYTHQFVNTREILLLFINPDTQSLHREVLQKNSMIDIATQIARFIFLEPFAKIFVVVIMVGMLYTLWRMPHGFFLWVVGVYLSGIAGMSFFKGEVIPHYLLFLIPESLVIFGYIFRGVTKKTIRYAAYICCAVVIIHNVMHFPDVFPRTIVDGDITRVGKVVTYIQEQTKGQPFSFGLIASPSFSDLHYRYAMMRQSVSPMPIPAREYSYLFLVCERDVCPSIEDLLHQQMIETLCNEKHCYGKYPEVDLSQWSYVHDSAVSSAHVYLFERKKFLGS